MLSGLILFAVSNLTLILSRLLWFQSVDSYIRTLLHQGNIEILGIALKEKIAILIPFYTFVYIVITKDFDLDTVKRMRRVNISVVKVDCKYFPCFESVPYVHIMTDLLLVQVWLNLSKTFIESCYFYT